MKSTVENHDVRILFSLAGNGKAIEKIKGKVINLLKKEGVNSLAIQDDVDITFEDMEINEEE
ncbi:MAG: hypothetical protein PHT94_00865 [Candidatus Nanoarchaeia archaeon]|nr:hypothetical protein [Candidatus Nanoarchaeia archaeon]